MWSVKQMVLLPFLPLYSASSTLLVTARKRKFQPDLPSSYPDNAIERQGITLVRFIKISRTAVARFLQVHGNEFLVAYL
jgi:hypothetical protein